MLNQNQNTDTFTPLGQNPNLLIQSLLLIPFQLLKTYPQPTTLSDTWQLFMHLQVRPNLNLNYPLNLLLSKLNLYNNLLLRNHLSNLQLYLSHLPLPLPLLFHLQLSSQPLMFNQPSRLCLLLQLHLQLQPHLPPHRLVLH